MASTQCSECDEEIEIAGRIRLGQKVTCNHCGALLEVVVVEPLEVEIAQEEEDDTWEADELDEVEVDDTPDDEADDELDDDLDAALDDLDDDEDDDLEDELEVEDDFDDDDFDDDLDDFEDDDFEDDLDDEDDDDQWS